MPRHNDDDEWLPKAETSDDDEYFFGTSGGRLPRKRRKISRRKAAKVKRDRPSLKVKLNDPRGAAQQLMDAFAFTNTRHQEPPTISRNRKRKRFPQPVAREIARRQGQNFFNPPDIRAIMGDLKPPDLKTAELELAEDSDSDADLLAEIEAEEEHAKEVGLSIEDFQKGAQADALKVDEDNTSVFLFRLQVNKVCNHSGLLLRVATHGIPRLESEKSTG